MPRTENDGRFNGRIHTSITRHRKPPRSGAVRGPRDLFEANGFRQDIVDLFVAIDRLMVEQQRRFASAIWQSSTPRMLLECPQSSFTETRIGEGIHGIEDHQIGAGKKSAVRFISAASSGLCSESVV